MKRLAAFLLLLALAACVRADAQAPGCGPSNPNCIVPTAPPGTSNNQAASTAFVQNAIGGGPGSGTVLAGQQNFLAFYPNSGTNATVGPLSSAAGNSVLTTGPGGAPSLATTLPSALTIPSPTISTPSITNPTITSGGSWASPTLTGATLSGTTSIGATATLTSPILNTPTIHGATMDNTGGTTTLASPTLTSPQINSGVTVNTGNTTLTPLGNGTSTQCLQITSAGLLQGAGAACGTGAGLPAGLANQIPVYTGTGNSVTATSGPSWFNNAFCNTVGYIIVRFTGAWACASSIPADVTWWGATCNGAGNDATSITNAINAVIASGQNAKSIMIPGNCQIGSAINVPAGVSIIGYHGVSRLQQTCLTCNILNINGNSILVEHLSLVYTSAASSGGAIVSNTRSGILVNDVYIQNAFNGVSSTNDNTMFYSFLSIDSAIQNSFLISNSSNINVTNFLFTASTSHSTPPLQTSQVTQCHIALTATSGSGGEGNNFAVGEVYGGNCPLKMYNSGARPAFNFFVNTYFDSNAIGAVILDAIGTNFNSTWFSTGRAGTGSPGLELGSSALNTQLVNSMISQNGAAGLVIDNGALYTIVKGNWFESNNTCFSTGVTDCSGGGSNHAAIEIASNATDFHIEGNVMNNALGAGLGQSYAVTFGNAASTRFHVTNNLVTSNASCGGGGAACINGTGTGNFTISQNW